MIKIALIGSILIIGALLLGWVTFFRCPTEIDINIGRFDTADAGLRASIPELASAVQRCPKTELYRIIWIGPGENGEPLQRSTLYYRKNSAIGHEQDAFSGASERGYIVDDAAIQAVANKGGTLSDFAEYDKNRR